MAPINHLNDEASAASLEKVGDTRVVIRNIKSDLEYLTLGTFSDCTAMCNGKSHKFSGFETYEVMWLLQWTYYHKPGQKVDVNALSTMHPTKNGLDSCIRLAQIAKFYQVEDLEKVAIEGLRGRCAEIMKASRKEAEVRGIEPFLERVLVPLCQAFSEERKPSTPDEVRWLVCRLIQKYKILLHKSYTFCKTLKTLDPHLRERCAVDGCENCAWADSAF